MSLKSKCEFLMTATGEYDVLKYVHEVFVLTLIKGNSSNLSDTTSTLKCVSEPLGTLCIYDSLTTSKCTGCKFSFNVAIIASSTGPTATTVLILFTNCIVRSATIFKHFEHFFITSSSAYCLLTSSRQETSYIHCFDLQLSSVCFNVLLFYITLWNLNKSTTHDIRRRVYLATIPNKFVYVNLILPISFHNGNP